MTIRPPENPPWKPLRREAETLARLQAEQAEAFAAVESARAAERAAAETDLRAIADARRQGKPEPKQTKLGAARHEREAAENWAKGQRRSFATRRRADAV